MKDPFSPLAKTAIFLFLVVLGSGVGIGLRRVIPLAVGKNPAELLLEVKADRREFESARQKFEDLLVRSDISEEDRNVTTAGLLQLLLTFADAAEDPEAAKTRAAELLDQTIGQEETASDGEEEELAQLLFRRGNLARELGEPAAAIGFFEKAAEKNPDHAFAKFNAGFTALEDLQDAAAAKSWFEKIGGALEEDAAFHFNFARALAALGDSVEARQHAEKALKLAPELRREILEEFPELGGSS
jgi:tetratricopeptide (TPR) repeat protein